MMLSSLPWIALAAVLAWASFSDVRNRRIPNAAIVCGWTAALLLNGLLPDGIGLASSMLGLLAGLIALMPLYMLRLLGAGDVKLVSVVGAFFGPLHLLGAVLLAFVAGGLLSLAMAWHHRTFHVLWGNLKAMLFFGQLRVSTGLPGEVPGALPASAGRMPYAVAIAAGALAQGLVLHLGSRA
jgi:prepilin peptidase CpaA